MVLKVKSVILIIITLFTIPINAQQKFKRFGVQQGICHTSIYNINQDRNGFIWLGTAEGLCRFDGSEFKSFANQEFNKVVNYSFKDSKGNLWFGYNNGIIQKYDGIHFKTIHTASEIKSAISLIQELNDGKILVATINDGLILIEHDKEFKRFTDIFKNKQIFAVYQKSNVLLLGSPDGLDIYEIDNNYTQYQFITTISELEYLNVKVIKETNNPDNFWIGTEDDGVFKLKTTEKEDYAINKLFKQDDIYINKLSDIFEDSKGNLWISSLQEGIIKVNKDDIQNIERIETKDGLPTNRIKEIFEDREGNIWIATYGEGLIFKISEAISFLNFEKEKINNNISAVCIIDKNIWIGGENALLKVSLANKNRIELFDSRKGLPKSKITALHYDNNDKLWIGTRSEGVYILNLNKEKLKKFKYSSTSLGNSVQSITGDNDKIYIGTQEGIFYYNFIDDITEHYTTLNRLPHNDINQVFLTSQKKLLLATQSDGIYQIDEFGEVKEFLRAGNFELRFNSIAEDDNNNLWASTYGMGIYLFLEDTVINFSAKDGLKSDYGYSIIADNDSNVWIGHRLGISKININNYAISVFDINKGITGDCNYNANFLDSNGIIYIGTTQGLFVYDYKKKENENIVPKTNITRLIISDKEYDFHKDLILPYSSYKIRIAFKGLLYRDPSTVRYQYILEGYDLEWSDITDINFALYPRIDDGEYTFKLKSFDANGRSENKPVKLKIKVKPPIWKTWWFITIMSLIIIILVVFVIKLRERKQKQLQEYLENKLEERTKEVVEQKEEIEIKNRDITDSINYAQRIQASILPPITRLQKSFSGSFVFYQPRDIVSGDFYWFDKVSETKFIIVCADSTGHGVPGAFMSMIGTTLIKDISMRPDSLSPSDILRNLDVELRNTLNQNVENEKATDGMDIIVCELDLKTHYLRYASAMRPMILYKDGEELYIKGSRSSVGGHYDKADKIFQDEGIQLSKGDIVYMFSDGYPDQFGGPIGKKFKMVRMKNLLKDIYKKPMEEQYKHIKNTFFLWKEDYPQVDDVLFMGIKL